MSTLLDDTGTPVEDKKRLQKWRSVEVDRVSTEMLSKRLNIPMPVAAVLAGRGLSDPVQAEEFLNPRLSSLSDPFSLPGMNEAVKRIWTAILGHEKIVVYGDYDIDGITSTALLVSVLGKLGANAGSFLPNRFTDGYGLSTGALRRCIETCRPGLVITVDCGTCAVDAVKLARSFGIDVVVTDHHEITGPLTEAVAVINPLLSDNSAVSHLAGVGVVFKLCHGLIKYGMTAGSIDGKNDPAELIRDIDLREWLDLVAIGTVGDVVPLTGENRILVHHGLNYLNKLFNGSDFSSGKTGQYRPGLVQLGKIAGLGKSDVNCYHIGFVIGPRLNAAGRLGSAVPALELLLTQDEIHAENLASILDDTNKERKRIEEDIMERALDHIKSFSDERNSFGIVTHDKGWHIGTIGIVASRLSSKFRRPVVVIGFDEDGLGRGSCRSTSDIDVAKVLSMCTDYLVSCGGHKMAAGLVIRKENVDLFHKRFNQICAGESKNIHDDSVYKFDAWLTHLGEIDAFFFKAMQRLEPFGMGNAKPVWGIRNVRVVGSPRKVGKNHLKMVVAGGASQFEAIGFEMADEPLPDGSLDMLFQVQEDNYRGRDSLQLNIKAFRPSENH